MLIWIWIRKIGRHIIREKSTELQNELDFFLIIGPNILKSSIPIWIWFINCIYRLIYLFFQKSWQINSYIWIWIRIIFYYINLFLKNLHQVIQCSFRCMSSFFSISWFQFSNKTYSVHLINTFLFNCFFCLNTSFIKNKVLTSTKQGRNFTSTNLFNCFKISRYVLSTIASIIFKIYELKAWWNRKKT